MAKGLEVFVALSLVIGVLQSANAEVPAIFILGDSTADVGTNNYLPESGIRADFPHNGVDFPFARATGRFSNGLNTADFLAKQFNFKRSPPSYLSLNATSAIKRRRFRGINFSSAGSGLLDTTGQTPQKNVVPMGEQVYQFSTVYNDLLAIKGPSETKNLLSKSLFFISIGSNDILGNYHSSNPMPKEQFIPNLGLVYEQHLRNLISVGARKFGIVSVPPVGCCPSQRLLTANWDCLEELNDQARAFFSMVDTLMRNLSSEFKDMKYSLGNAVEMALDVIDNHLNFNITDVMSACCGNGTLNAESFCTPTANLCSNRRRYFFWDLFHPTQTASRLAAFTLYSGEPRFVAPINFSQLPEA
ncbi:hypothetical protein QUC31_015641 [Theobroma cacao]|uniref:GDSL-like Lipase/Acylhydrolase superfamily protein, putative n=1 Tax=Theobroma cacao TaxID=3641 RepID=A0A061DYP1_THECC|nr:GDSL-like Lipase/Acylhydrolase superfamily protein, putative [Theobroma cacao]